MGDEKLIILPPPARFRPARGVEWARFSDNAPTFKRKGRVTGRRLQGVKYEIAAQAMVNRKFKLYIENPWLIFYSEGGLHYCRPDGLLFDFKLGVIIIVEMKYQHTTDAWWQVRKLYEPVLRRMFPETLWTFHFLELVKWFDSAVKWPEQIRMIENIEDTFHISHEQTGVHIWKP
jgi:hypothetical protein